MDAKLFFPDIAAVTSFAYALNREPTVNRSRIIVTLCIIGPWLWFFGPVLFTSQSFAFRDAAHFYHPLFRWTSEHCSAGQLPLWNALENGGMPVLADTTSSVLYPGKLVLFLPGLSFATRYEMYVALHVLLAASGLYVLARSWRYPIIASGAGALTYAFCGNVLFQYCNAVFLVGAAWLPWALLAAERMLRRSSWTWAAWFGAVLALMTLGGDPQMAYHAGLAAVLLWIMASLRRGYFSPRPAAHTASLGVASVQTRIARHPFSLLGLAALTGILLAAVQILPGIQWQRLSNRAHDERPRNIYEVANRLLAVDATESAERFTAIRQGLLSQPEDGSHHASIYDFSVSPWRGVELIWPGFSGRPFPQNHRWLQAVNAEDRVWTPTIYMGLLPLLLAIAAIKLRGGTIRRQWISWLIVLAVLGSFGRFGLGWLLHSLQTSLLGPSADKLIYGEPVGGLYWLMVTCLPGYSSFRYPAKLLILAALGISLLSVMAWDRALTTRPQQLMRSLRTIVATSILMAAGLALGQSFWGPDFLSSARPDTLFGPIDPSGVASDIRSSLLHAAALGAVLLLILRRYEWQNAMNRQLVGTIALAVTAIDLAAAQYWTIPKTSERVWNESPMVARWIRDHEGQIEANPTSHMENSSRTRDPQDLKPSYRVYRGCSQRWYPDEWRTSNSAVRLDDWMAWNRDTLYPRFNLLTEHSLLGSYGSMVAGDYLALMQVAKRYGYQRPDGVQEPHPLVMSALTARYFIMPAGLEDCLEPYGLTPIHPHRSAAAAESCRRKNVACWYNPHHLPRTWIVHEVHRLAPLNSRRLPLLRKRSEQIWFPDGELRNLLQSAVVETDQPNPFVPRAPSAPTTEYSRLVSHSNHRVVIEARLTTPGLLVLNDLYFPGWNVEVTDQQSGQRRRAPVVRTNRTMRGVFLPAGRHHVAFNYRPAAVAVGASISLTGWMLLGLAIVLGAARRSLSRRMLSQSLTQSGEATTRHDSGTWTSRGTPAVHPGSPAAATSSVGPQMDGDHSDT